MEIVVALDVEDPPTGRVLISGRDPRGAAFVGWLDLLRVLAELIEARDRLRDGIDQFR